MVAWTHMDSVCALFSSSSYATDILGLNSTNSELQQEINR